MRVMFSDICFEEYRGVYGDVSLEKLDEKNFFYIIYVRDKDRYVAYIPYILPVSLYSYEHIDGWKDTKEQNLFSFFANMYMRETDYQKKRFYMQKAIMHMDSFSPAREEIGKYFIPWPDLNALHSLHSSVLLAMLRFSPKGSS